MEEMAAATDNLRADARRNRELIVSAAGELFAVEGMECPVSEVARRAGVGNATVFRHFPTKRDLLMAIVEQRLDDMVDLAESCVAEPDPGVGLERLVSGMAEFMARNTGLKEMSSRHFDGDVRLVSRRDRLLGCLAELVERAKAAGTIRRDVEAIDLAMMVNGIALAVAGLEEERPGLHRRYIALALAGLTPAAAADGAPLPGAPPSADEVEGAWKRQRAAGRGC